MRPANRLKTLRQSRNRTATVATTAQRRAGHQSDRLAAEQRGTGIFFPLGQRAARHYRESRCGFVWLLRRSETRAPLNYAGAKVEKALRRAEATPRCWRIHLRWTASFVQRDTACFVALGNFLENRIHIIGGSSSHVQSCIRKKTQNSISYCNNTPSSLDHKTGLIRSNRLKMNNYSQMLTNEM